MKPLLEHISIERMADDLWRLVNVPSPTGNEREAALLFAELLAKAGAKVEIDERIYSSPNIIGRLKGNRPGKTVQLAGHIDHIDVPHAPPTRTAQEISARGVSDMKSGLVGILEIVRLLKSLGSDFPGELLVTVYGLHEAPVGQAEGLRNMIEDGVIGDAAIVVESIHPFRDKAVVQGKGQSIWDITVRRGGEVCHELNRNPEMDGLLNTALAVQDRLLVWADELAASGDGGYMLGSPSLFIGQIHYGDFYNRVPISYHIQGTRRWLPDQSFIQVQADLAGVVESVSCAEGISVEISWTFVGEAYAMDPQESIVRHFRTAYRQLTGREMEVAGVTAVVDGARLVPWGDVPTILCAFDNRCAHADQEVVTLENLRQPCKLTLLTVLNYLAEKDE
ncbi:MAG: M20/M25/M40 family metallo-hydrolase [Anaerolineae bacterium]|nr:M20/M25/M40 family metallo-hydrolase [Anaerolineae bacterium]